MKIDKLAFDELPQFSVMDKAYVNEIEALQPFYTYGVKAENFEQIIAAKHFDKAERATLVSVLKEQYKGREITASTAQNLNALRAENCYTITTAHQPNLFTGPLYFILKIASVIQLTEQLKLKYPAHNFVPVYWSGGEDHDFDELNHTFIFGKKIEWTDAQGGSVGSYSTISLQPVIDELEQMLENTPFGAELIEALRTAYRTDLSYGEGTLRLVNWLFGKYGLLVIDPSDKALKRSFIPIMRKELVEQPSYKLMQEAKEALELAGLSTQAYARPVNLFYLTEGKRSRIELEEGRYTVKDSALSFSQEEILQVLEEFPERFSPNVILRPLYQEMLLPNLAYIGGGGEIAYWLERKQQFNFYKLPYPMLIRRDSALWIGKDQQEKLDQYDLTLADLMQDRAKLERAYVLKHTENEVHCVEEAALLDQMEQLLKAKALLADKSLEGSAASLVQQMHKGLAKFEQKIIKAEKRKQETALRQIGRLADQLFPNGGLQERKDNFMMYYARLGASFIATIVAGAAPLDKTVKVFIEDDK